MEEERCGFGHRLAPLLAVLSCILALATLGQTTGGSLQGRVVDEAGKPIPGVLIQVSGPSVQGYLGSATDADGLFLVAYVPAGRGYEVKAEVPGYATVVRKGIAIPLGARVDVPFTMGEGKTEIVVTAAAPQVDLKSAETGATLSSRMIQSIPLQRNANQIAFLAPMAVDGGPATPNDPAISGSTGSENNYLINGMDVTDARRGTNGTLLNFDFIQEMQVITGGLPPEYGAAMGGVVNTITRSGGNEFHGSVFGYYWSDQTQAESITYPYYSNFFGNGGYRRYDVGATLGGYILKDKLWFYLAYDYNRYEEFTDYPIGPQYGDRYLSLNGQPAQTCYAGQRFTSDSLINPMIALKLTWNASPDQKVAFSLFGNDRRERFIGGPGWSGVLVPFAWTYEEEENNTNWVLQWNSTWTPKFFSEADLGYRRRTVEQTVPPVAEANWFYFYRYPASYFGAYPKDQTVPPVSYNYPFVDLGSNYQPALGWGGYSGLRDETQQARLKFTNLLGGAGRHELSYGLQYQKIDYTPSYYTSGPDTMVSPFLHLPTIGGIGGVGWRPLRAGMPPGPNGEQYYYAVYDSFTPKARPNTERFSVAWVNDNWSLTDYFTLKLGLRYDEENLTGHLTGLSINLTDNWAPRVGFTWDVKHNAKSKFYGFAGRYYERVPMEIAVDGLNHAVSGVEYYYDPGLTEWTHLRSDIYGAYEYIQGQLIPSGPLGPQEAAAYSRKLKAPYTDEYILGYDYQVRPDLTLGVRAVYRELGRTIEDISLDGGWTYVIANPDVWTKVPAPSQVFPGEVMYLPEPKRRYEALGLTLDKRYSNRWQLSGSFVYSRLKGNYEGTASNDFLYGQNMPNLNATYDLPDLMLNGYGFLPLDRTYVFKAFGSYFFEDVPLQLSGVFNLQSGTPLSNQMGLFWYGGGVVFLQPRGEAGRTPWTWTLDLGVEYDFKLPMTSHLGVRIDVFNVTNNQVGTQFYQTSCHQDGYGNVYPDPLYRKAWSHQTPRTARFALRWTF